MGNHAGKRGEGYLVMKKTTALVFVALCAVCMASHARQNNALQEEPVMTRPDTHSTMDTLEKFNDPRNFMATRKSFDIATFKKHRADRHQYLREDGVFVKQLYLDSYGYQEELTRSDSHYEYGYGYYKSGQLKGMGVRFCGYGVGEGLWFDESGNIIKRQNLDYPYLPIEQLRERFLEQTRSDKTTGIDIYDTEKVVWVRHSQFSNDENFYYDIYVRRSPNSMPPPMGPNDLTAYLLDGVSGTILFTADAVKGFSIGPSAYGKYAQYLQRIGKTHQEYLEILKSREHP
ncbi:MAG: hypothetical protein LBU45_08365 [Azoarcus sp.]|nr:hypothetical protein [Azoarcus sp.]